ncbi:hypothetical protein C4G88_RS02660 [Vibrio parahaemolyticus O3:K56]|nr:hypothetical protein [Vibrio parahaemolyticus]EJG0871440.1 hypothetical protein [Vibrio parahaemolyticus O3]EJG0900099.1 hypothetical protein [Vibrio parahaemolyticus O3:K56]EJG1072950.1 hypothetical protein [Vibrio parahaemolyticus O1:K56]EII3144754.1 hypothetical protein [Vibrio parahaemolyticus]
MNLTICLTLQVNHLYDLLERQKQNSVKLEEQVTLLELQLDLLKLNQQISTVDQLGSNPETLYLSQYLRRRILLFKRQFSDVASTELFRNKLPTEKFEQVLFLFIETLNRNINTLEVCGSVQKDFVSPDVKMVPRRQRR